MANRDWRVLGEQAVTGQWVQGFQGVMKIFKTECDDGCRAL